MSKRLVVGTFELSDLCFPDSSHSDIIRIYNKILDGDWFSAGLFVT